MTRFGRHLNCNQIRSRPCGHTRANASQRVFWFSALRLPCVCLASAFRLVVCSFHSQPVEMLLPGRRKQVHAAIPSNWPCKSAARGYSCGTLGLIPVYIRASFFRFLEGRSLFPAPSCLRLLAGYPGTGLRDKPLFGLFSAALRPQRSHRPEPKKDGDAPTAGIVVFCSLPSQPVSCAL